MQFRQPTLTLWILFAILCSLPACTPAIVDSALTDIQAIWTNQPPDAPEEIQQQLVAVDVHYYGFDRKLHQGQVVIHKELAPDIRQLFAVIRETRFPVESVLPIAHPLVQLKGPFGLSPDTNNTSAYVWRPIVGSRTVSLHGLGLAIDFNPRLNPYCKGDLILPPGATYEPTKPGTLTPGSRVVQAFKELGWEWGGDWAEKGKVDYMHFQKIPSQLEPWVKNYRK
ncbi:M15 family metallopeptidase [Desulfovibrio ferrophilus]|uniref:Peptidase M15C domain-containing protein n=1 Tax=Desulfovibrio ferrophilus TaxID=241368 RepID=A0A2Z6AYG8_9BACT|nr:M15 family metallopeptidase [Desulfovibrio ferrophilus]BBD08301.1 putative uncharacterized protein [Desulfovibrio ferrophilus]